MFRKFFNNFFVRREIMHKRDFSSLKENNQSNSVPINNNISISQIPSLPTSQQNLAIDYSDISLEGNVSIEDVANLTDSISALFENSAKNQTLFKYQTVKPISILTLPKSWVKEGEIYWNVYREINPNKIDLFEPVKDNVDYYGIKIKKTGFYKVTFRQRADKAGRVGFIERNGTRDLKYEPNSIQLVNPSGNADNTMETYYIGTLSRGDIITAGGSGNFGKFGTDVDYGHLIIEFLNDIPEFYGLQALTFKDKSERGYLPFDETFADMLGLLNYTLFNFPELDSEKIFENGVTNFNHNGGIVYHNINSNEITLSFEIYWNGNDNVTPISFADSAIWIKDGIIGLNDKNGAVLGGKIEANKWYHIYTVFSENPKVYINGKLGTETIKSLNISSLIRTKGNMQINGLMDGESASKNFSNFGALKNLRIYNKAQDVKPSIFKHLIPEANYFIK